MPNPYLEFVSRLSKTMSEAKGIPLASAQCTVRCDVRDGEPCVMIFSPHPDDEVIVGALALRLLRQSGWRVINVAVTQGSNKARQAARWSELEACCRTIGFDLVQAQEGGFEQISEKGRVLSPENWAEAVARITELLRTHRPPVILLPHARDWNGTHIGTHHLVMQALACLGSAFSCWLVETEFWAAMDDPNLMVECSDQDLADLIAALSHHKGEVSRNPYHLSLPAWMMDNVRRGGELVGGQGAATPDFRFATLYRLSRWENGRKTPQAQKKRFLAVSDDPASLFLT